MRVLIDTNILISASLSRTGIPYQAYIKAVTGPNEGLVSDQNIDELRRVYNRKFPDKILALERFWTFPLTGVEVIIKLLPPTYPMKVSFGMCPATSFSAPRLKLKAQADILITGDKDILDSGIKKPKIMTASAFVNRE